MNSTHESMDRDAYIFQISISRGGVPKRAVPQAEVTPDGLVGDRVNHPDIHGGPERALCLYSLERILALQAEGHPIVPGSLGENLTIAGLGWPQVEPGMRLRLGDSVLIEVTRYTSPCETISGSFAGGESSRVSQKLHRGWSRVYGRVLRPGRIRVGDRVAIAASIS